MRCTCAHLVAGNPLSPSLSFSLGLSLFFVVICFVLRAQIFFSVLFMFSLPRSVRIVLGREEKRAEPVSAENAKRTDKNPRHELKKSLENNYCALSVDFFGFFCCTIRLLTPVNNLFNL